MKIEFNYQFANEPIETQVFEFKDRNNALFIAGICDDLSSHGYVIKSIRCIDK